MTKRSNWLFGPTPEEMFAAARERRLAGLPPKHELSVVEALQIKRMLVGALRQGRKKLALQRKQPSED